MESLYPQRLGVGQATAKTRAKENNIKAHVLQRHPIKWTVMCQRSYLHWGGKTL